MIAIRHLLRMLCLAVPPLAATVLAAPASAAVSVRADFDGDGRADLAVGAPRDSVSGHGNAGAVNVLYGSSRGLRASGDEEFTQDTPGVKGGAEGDDRFGSALAAGDFDGDGYGDLAVGVPGEDVGGVSNTGAVNVLFGSRRGLTTRDEMVGQGFAGVPGTREAEQDFGAALAAGDLDGDGHADLAVGTPDDSVTGHTAAGAVNVLYGTSRGLRGGADQLWTQDTPGIKGIAADFHRFGFALATGDLDGDGRAELAIGIPGGRIAGHQSAGAVEVLYGSRRGLREDPDQLWSQGARGIKGGPEDGDNFGRALAMGDFEGDGDDDLAVGVPFEDLGTVVDAGAAQVLYGTRHGLRGADELVGQSSPGIKGGPERGDRMGASLVAGDFDGDGEDDLAIGVPLEDLRGRADVGAVNVLYGAQRGGVSSRDDFWAQASHGIKGVSGAFDNLGTALAAADFDADGRADLAMAAPRDRVAGAVGAGAVNVLRGSGRGLTERGDQLWTQATPGVKGAVGGDGFGTALAPSR